MKLGRLLPIALLSLAVSCGSSTNEKIEGVEWKAETLYGAAVNGADADSYTLNFGDDSNLSGKGECNRLMGKYSVKCCGELKIEAVGSTMMFCPNIETEDNFKKGLESVTNYTAKGGELTLLNGEEVVATFKKAE